MTNQPSNAASASQDDPLDTEAETLDDSDVTSALMAALSNRDMGEPSVDLNLSLLTPTERRAVLQLLNRHLELGEAVRQVTDTEPVDSTREMAR